jgi:hypothetical protein
MNQDKQRKIEEAGGSVGTVQDFLGLTNGEMSIIAIKLLLVEYGDYNNTILVTSDTIDYMLEKLIDSGCSISRILLYIISKTELAKYHESGH